MDIELNIRLDIRGRRNSVADCTARANQVIGALEHSFKDVQCRRHTFEWEDDAGELHLGDMIVASVKGITFKQRYEYLASIHAIAKAMEQDCIAVYYPFTKRGDLIGPEPSPYGPFDISKFVFF